ncbi:hypothetical protein AU378_09845 [Chryseobacterium kwangjuense]|uniref:Uncharacterized protein n=1 Tax=Chryseobacterium kwangjuense TaxID=267125 RepID=A0A135WCT8_9FLAO|nr:hypothetical protein AU378_09845 [Chryseobacterium kwangjuense]
MKDIFTLKNFSRSLILGLVWLVLYYLIRIIFKHEDEDWMFYVLMFFTFFMINFVLGNGNMSLNEMFKPKNKTHS